MLRIPRLIVVAQCCALLLLLLVTTPVAAELHSLSAYEANINRSCQIDADCTVKDVHNCCGYFPACVNRDAQTDPGLVRRLCEQEQMAGICGFPEITACRCVNSVCADAGNSGNQVNPVGK